MHLSRLTELIKQHLGQVASSMPPRPWQMGRLSVRPTAQTERLPAPAPQTSMLTRVRVPTTEPQKNKRPLTLRLGAGAGGGAVALETKRCCLIDSVNSDVAMVPGGRKADDRTDTPSFVVALASVRGIPHHPRTTPDMQLTTS